MQSDNHSRSNTRSSRKLFHISLLLLVFGLTVYTCSPIGPVNSDTPSTPLPQGTTGDELPQTFQIPTGKGKIPEPEPTAAPTSTATPVLTPSPTAYEESLLNYERISYDNIFRYNEGYTGTDVYFKGEILQSLGNPGNYQFRVATKSNTFGYSGDVIYVFYDKEDIRYLEGDIIEIYGVSERIIEYESIFGKQIQIPGISADIVELISENGNNEIESDIEATPTPIPTPTPIATATPVPTVLDGEIKIDEIKVTGNYDLNIKIRVENTGNVEFRPALEFFVFDGDDEICYRTSEYTFGKLTVSDYDVESVNKFDISCHNLKSGEYTLETKLVDEKYEIIDEDNKDFTITESIYDSTYGLALENESNEIESDIEATPTATPVPTVLDGEIKIDEIKVTGNYDLNIKIRIDNTGNVEFRPILEIFVFDGDNEICYDTSEYIFGSLMVSDYDVESLNEFSIGCHNLKSGEYTLETKLVDEKYETIDKDSEDFVITESIYDRFN